MTMTIYLDSFPPWLTKKNNVDRWDELLWEQRTIFLSVYPIHRRSVDICISWRCVKTIDSPRQKSPSVGLRLECRRFGCGEWQWCLEESEMFNDQILRRDPNNQLNFHIRLLMMGQLNSFCQESFPVRILHSIEDGLDLSMRSCHWLEKNRRVLSLLCNVGVAEIFTGTPA